MSTDISQLSKSIDCAPSQWVNSILDLVDLVDKPPRLDAPEVPQDALQRSTRESR
jgi:hypothetical protein